MQNVVKETVVQKTDNGIAAVATVNSSDTPIQIMANIIYFITGLCEVALLARFILKITAANSGSGFVSGIYGFTQFLIMPFRGIFPTAVSSGTEMRSVFEPATLVAMLVYATLAWGIVKLIAILAGQSHEEL
jgi:hypothetical protein